MKIVLSHIFPFGYLLVSLLICSCQKDVSSLVAYFPGYSQVAEQPSEPSPFALHFSQKIVYVDSLSKSELIHIWVSSKTISDFKVVWDIDKTESAFTEGQSLYLKIKDNPGWIKIRARVLDPDSGWVLTTLTDSILVCRQIIILKADDMVYEKGNVISTRWKKFLQFIVENKLKADVGIIGISLESEDPAYFLLLRKYYETGRIEFWNHGYTHELNFHSENQPALLCEFLNTNLDFQYDHLMKTQTLARERLGIVLKAFGAPGNAIDETTREALNNIPDIKIWFFGLPDTSKLVLQRQGEIEFPTHHPDYQKFLLNYNPHLPYIVYQIHPKSWGEEEFAQFRLAINYLRNQEVTFLNASEYYRLIKNTTD